MIDDTERKCASRCLCMTAEALEIMGIPLKRIDDIVERGASERGGAERPLNGSDETWTPVMLRQFSRDQSHDSGRDTFFDDADKGWNVMRVESMSYALEEVQRFPLTFQVQFFQLCHGASPEDEGIQCDAGICHTTGGIDARRDTEGDIAT